MKQNLDDRLINFAAQIIDIVAQLPNSRPGIHLGNQLLRSGTSPALNYGEAQGAESKKDFIHKFKIVLKELRETWICLRILIRIKYLKDDNAASTECNELIAIFVRSLITASKNQVNTK